MLSHSPDASGTAWRTVLLALSGHRGPGIPCRRDLLRICQGPVRLRAQTSATSDDINTEIHQCSLAVCHSALVEKHDAALWATIRTQLAGTPSASSSRRSVPPFAAAGRRDDPSAERSARKRTRTPSATLDRGVTRLSGHQGSGQATGPGRAQGRQDVIANQTPRRAFHCRSARTPELNSDHTDVGDPGQVTATHCSIKR